MNSKVEQREELKERLLDQIEGKKVPELKENQKQILANAQAIDARSNKGWGPGGGKKVPTNFAKQMELWFEETNNQDL